MRKYDFLLIYETKARELESICLLKYELERRGYSVAILETWWCLRHYYRPIPAKVLVTLALYNDSLVYAAGRMSKDYKVIVDLQWEQIFSNMEEEKPESPHHFHGMSQSMVHIAWGPFTVDKLVRICGIPERNVVLTGHISMDFIKPRFCGYYMSREELFRKYHISNDSKVVLFISSFSYVGMPEKLLESDIYQKNALPANDFRSISSLSQKKLLQWINEVLPRHPDCTFIYRPHPAEADNAILRKMEKEVSNFRVIYEHSIKQWILAADKIYSWYSTSVADAFFCGKAFEILRPIELPRDMEIILYNHSRFITSIQEFEHSLHCCDSELPIDKSHFEHFYSFDHDVYSYVLICDTLERLFYDPEDRCTCIRENLKMPAIWRIFRMPLARAKRLSLRLLGAAYAAGMFHKTKRSLAKIAKYEAYVRQMIQENYADQREIQALQDKIEKIISVNTNGHV